MGSDVPLLSYAGEGLSQPSYLHADQQGSIIMVSDQAGNPTINRYDEYGIPASTNAGRFQYTGQALLTELGMYYYKARIYSPTLGRFLQTDPVGYEDQFNLYAYVGNDPVNGTDPSGSAQHILTPNCASCHSARPPVLPRLPVPSAPTIVRTIVNLGLCLTVQMCGPFVAQVSMNEREEEYEHNPGPFRTSPEDGRIHENDLDRPIDDEDLDEAIDQLEHSVGERERENRNEPHGNPSGDRLQQRQNETWRGHQERIRRETERQEELESRRRIRDRPL